MNKTAIPATITIPAAEWGEYIALKAEKSATEKALKALEAKWDLPKPSDIVGEGEKASCLIVDGNGNEQGKIGYYWHNGATIPAGARRRIS